MTLHVRPSTLAEANDLVRRWHRHRRKRVVVHRFSIAAVLTPACAPDRIVGAAIVANPVARALDDGFTAEVRRLVTDGTRNACSMLYGACWRTWRAMGGRRLVTYTLASEPGTTLRAAGWRPLYETRARAKGWDCVSRPRDPEPQEAKRLWEITA